MSSSNLDCSCKLEIIQKKKDFCLIKWFQLIFSLDYDFYLFKTYTDCSKIIHHTENRYLKNFQYFFLICNLSVTRQLLPLKLYMYFLPLKMTKKYDSEKALSYRLLQFNGILPLLIRERNNMNIQFACVLMFF